MRPLPRPSRLRSSGLVRGTYAKWRARNDATHASCEYCEDEYTFGIEKWSLTSLREKLIKIAAKVVSRGRYVAFQMAEVAIPRALFAEILQRIAALRSPPPQAAAT